MPGQIVVSANTLTAGIRADFASEYASSYETSKARLANCMDLGVPSDKLTEIYAYYKTAPYPRIWKRGDAIPQDAFDSVQFSVTNRDWAIQVEWNENDREDDQTRSLMQRAREAGTNFATLSERVFFQILTGSVSNDLLPAIPTAPDGAAMYAATDGSGAARFGATGGNLVTGSGVASSAAIRTDFYNAIEQLRLFQDTQGQPLHSEDYIDKGLTVVYPVSAEMTFREAFQQGRTLAADTTAQSNAAVSNIIMESGLNITLWGSPRITDNDWFVFANGAPLKPVFQQVRRPLRESYANMDNSDLARTTKIESVSWDSRDGFGVFLPYSTVKVNN